MTRMQQAAQWLGEKTQAFDGRSVVFIRGSEVSTPVTAVPSMTELTVISDEGFGTLVKSWDWRFITAQLPWEIRKGDRIRDALGSEYELLPLKDRPAIEHVGTTGVLTDVHTKKVK